ncbi:MAG: NAD/NADP octopine/nopaline dehydrogenase family protein [Bacillota bacterium]
MLAPVNEAFPQFAAAESVLHTSFDNIGAIFHPAPTLLNAARIETGDTFGHYCEGVSPSVARVLEEMDRERRNVARAIGLRVRSAERFLRQAYGVRAHGLYQAMKSNPGYQGIPAPSSVEHRYITEDVPTSLVPMASFGDVFGAPTPTIKSIIHLASVMHGVDYWRIGRTVDRLGLSGMNAEQIREMVTDVHSDQMVG